MTIDLDSTICETYVLGKEGARRHGYTGQRGYHPLLAVAAVTGEVLMPGCVRAGPTPPEAPPTSCGRRWAAALCRGQGSLTVRADSGFYTHSIVAVLRKMGVRFSITVASTGASEISSRPFPRGNGGPIPYWMEGAPGAEAEYTPFPG